MFLIFPYKTMNLMNFFFIYFFMDFNYSTIVIILILMKVNPYHYQNQQ